MSDVVTREEHKLLQDRVSVVEREVDGEKMLSRYILQQVRANGDDLAGVKTRLDRVETRLDGVQVELQGLKSEMRGLKQDVVGLRKDLPSMIAQTMREVLREGK